MFWHFLTVLAIVLWFILFTTVIVKYREWRQWDKERRAELKKK